MWVFLYYLFIYLLEADYTADFAEFPKLLSYDWNFDSISLHNSISIKFLVYLSSSFHSDWFFFLYAANLKQFKRMKQLKLLILPQHDVSVEIPI